MSSEDPRCLAEEANRATSSVCAGRPRPCGGLRLYACGIREAQEVITTAQNRPPLSIATVSADPPEGIPRGARRYHMPLFAPVDLLRQSASELAAFCRFVDAGLAEGSVYVHCEMGASRSVCTTIFYLMTLGVPLRDAVLGVASTRGCIDFSSIDVIALQRLEGRVAEVRELLADIPTSKLADCEALSQAFQQRL